MRMLQQRAVRYAVAHHAFSSWPFAVCRCAGVCHFSRSGGCRIKLSEPLLKVYGCRVMSTVASVLWMHHGQHQQRLQGRLSILLQPMGLCC